MTAPTHQTPQTTAIGTLIRVPDSPGSDGSHPASLPRNVARRDRIRASAICGQAWRSALTTSVLPQGWSGKSLRRTTGTVR